MTHEALHAAFRGTSLADLLAAISKLPDPDDADDTEWLVSDDVLGILRAFYPETGGFDDLKAAARNAIEVILKHKTTLPHSELRGSIAYLAGLLEERLDTSGFSYLGSSPNLAVYLELNTAAETLRSKSKADADTLHALAAVLKRIEDIHHTVYSYLRVIGDRHLEAIEFSTGAMTPSAADMVLHALDGFEGNEAVAALYERMIDRLPKRSSLREDFAKYLSRVRPDESSKDDADASSDE